MVFEKKSFSCETQSLFLTNDLFLNIESEQTTDAMFIVFTKAFDKVPQNFLLLKLSTLKLDPFVISRIECLTNRQHFIYVNNTTSPLSPVTFRVSQKTVLGPQLFLIYINNLPLQLISALRLFADDHSLFFLRKQP